MLTDILHAFLGGLLVGLAALLLLMADGRIAGISGMIGAMFRTQIQMNGWRLAFLGGLVVGGLVLNLFGFSVFSPLAHQSMSTLILAGVLVGFGTQLGSGCTSGHGVCGIGRGSLRSIIATLTFMAAGMITVFIVRHLGGATL